jgi:hypothetical protein
MFIFTTKFNKKKAVIAVLVLAAILIAIILIAGGSHKANANSKETAVLSAVVKNNDQRINYLKSLGWEVDKKALEEQKVVIPRDFSDVYKKYNEIQISQGFDLQKFGGIAATRYTYKVLNYPQASGNVVADIIIYHDEVIAGDIQSNALDGFMVGLRYPRTVSPSPSAQSSAAPSSSAPSSAAPNTAAPSSSAPNPSAPNPSAPNAASGAITSDSMASDSLAAGIPESEMTP